jgi:hypothetical protein
MPAVFEDLKSGKLMSSVQPLLVYSSSPSGDPFASSRLRVSPPPEPKLTLQGSDLWLEITDIYATAIDYDVTAKATKRFFATLQNKLHWAIHGQTAAEIIVDRADAEKRHMGHSFICSEFQPKANP